MSDQDDDIIERMAKRGEADRELAAQNIRDRPPLRQTRYVASHEDSVRTRLGWIVGGVWVIAGAVIANFIASLVIGAAAAASSNPF